MPNLIIVTFGNQNYKFFIPKAWFCFILLWFFNDFDVKIHETLRTQWFGAKQKHFYQFYQFYQFFKTLLTDPWRAPAQVLSC